MTEPAVVSVDSVDELDVDELVRCLTERGAVHVRGAAADEAALDRVFARFCGRSTCDPGKVVTGGMRGAGGQVGRAARVAARTVSQAIRRTVGDSSGDHTFPLPQ